MFIAGNMSTGIWIALTRPSIASTSAATTTRYGVRMAKRDTSALLRVCPDVLALAQLRVAADHDALTVGESGAHFHELCGLQSEGHGLHMNPAAVRDGEHARFAIGA